MDSKYLIKHPKDQLFYKVIAYVMGLLALNTQYWAWFDLPQHVLYRCHRKMMLVIVPAAIYLQILYLAVHYKELEFETLSMIYTIVPIAITVLLKFSLAQTESYKSLMEDFMAKIHLYNSYIIDREDYVQKTLITAEKYSRWTCFYFIILCYTCGASFAIVPILHNLQHIESYDNVTRRLEIVIHIWLPLDYEFDFTNWAIVQVVMVYVAFLAVSYIFLFDTVNMIVIYHLIGHIAIFKHRVKITFDDNTMSEREIEDNFIELSRYYTFIIRTLKHAKATFGLNVASIYIHNLVGGGLFIYQLMTSGRDTGTLLTYGLLIPIYMGILIIVSFALENIRIIADDVPDLIYGISWEAMSLSNQKLVLMLLTQVQPSLEFLAAFNIKTGVQPAINIIRTTFSYYVMIKSSVK